MHLNPGCQWSKNINCHFVTNGRAGSDNASSRSPDAVALGRPTQDISGTASVRICPHCRGGFFSVARSGIHDTQPGPISDSRNCQIMVTSRIFLSRTLSCVNVSKNQPPGWIHIRARKWWDNSDKDEITLVMPLDHMGNVKATATALRVQLLATQLWNHVRCICNGRKALRSRPKHGLTLHTHTRRRAG